MIPFEVEYVQPASISEALAAYQEARSSGRETRYLAGGTELVTMARDGKLSFEVLIDLKRIPETTVWDPELLRFGSCIRLSRLADEAPVSLLASAARGVADRTVRNSITLGGNISGMLPYRETILPLLVCDADFEIAGPAGTRTAAAAEVFIKRLTLADGEFLVSVRLPSLAPEAFFYSRRTRDARVDYPLCAICMAKVNGEIRLSVSGAFSYPLRDAAAEAVINDLLASVPATAKYNAARYSEVATAAVAACETAFRTDHRAGGDYRMRLLELSIADGLAHMEGNK